MSTSHPTHCGALSWLQKGIFCLVILGSSIATAAEPDLKDPFLRDPDSIATKESEMKPYKQRLRHTEIDFHMLPIPGGEYIMGSPKDEEDREDDEGPQHKVKIDPFWMGKYEITWDEYDTWRLNLDIQRRDLSGLTADDVDKNSDGVTRPTKEYTDMTFGMGHDGFP
ncbi:SUMF1/EgtB/PvdO family nonheme iron enzyme, partial [Planctomicrobium sp.]